MKNVITAILLSLPLAIGGTGSIGVGSSDAPGGTDTPPAATSPAQPDRPDNSSEGEASVRALAEATNRYRESQGVPALRINDEISSVAGAWSERMANENRMYHNPSYSSQMPSGWSKVSENVLQNHRGASADDLVRQWANSPGHNRNMLDRDMTDLGVGIAIASDGKLYATQNFGKYSR